MENVSFACANVPVAEAAKALKMDCQTVQLLLQNGVVGWGVAYKRTPNSHHYSYLISPKKFFEETGFVYRPDKGVQEL